MSTVPSEPAPRIPLSRDRVLRAGIELADEHGADWLSMRKLAGHLGYEAMSLYNHVTSKDDLFEGMVDLVVAEVELPPEGVDWKTGIRQIAVAEHDALLRHPWAAPMLPFRFPGPARWSVAEAQLRLLTEGGFRDHLRDVGFHAITLHIAGFTQQQISYQFSDDFADAMMRRFDHEVPLERYPLMFDHVRYHQEWERIPGERPDEYRFVLDLILDGLERLRDA